MQTGEISQKTARGKHTTRHVEIFEIDGGGMIFDTPGFTSLMLLRLTKIISGNAILKWISSTENADMMTAATSANPAVQSERRWKKAG